MQIKVTRTLVQMIFFFSGGFRLWRHLWTYTQQLRIDAIKSTIFCLCPIFLSEICGVKYTSWLYVTKKLVFYAFIDASPRNLLHFFTFLNANVSSLLYYEQTSRYRETASNIFVNSDILFLVEILVACD